MRPRIAVLGAVSLLAVGMLAQWGMLAELDIQPRAAAQTQGPSERPFVVVARRYSFSPARIEVFEGDLVRIELRTDDIAHSLTIEGLRIAKRVGPERPVSFEFRAERPGVFPFYCDLKIDDGCRRMRGELVVQPRR
jgi:heme/copper-type cytochrome/quinol oxidase subunit 2